MRKSHHQVREDTMNGDDDSIENSPLGATIRLIGGKYKAYIVWRLADGSLRYNEIRDFMGSATPRMLSKQLHELESDGLISRKVIQKSPMRVEYSLTPTGRSMLPVLEFMAEWGAAYLEMEREIVTSSRSPR